MDKVLGMGNALVDIMTKLNSDLLLEKFSLPKASMQLCDINFIKKITENTTELEKQQSSGGSAANTIRGLANLGVKTGFIGKIGDDEFGKFFRNDLENGNIEAKLFTGKSGTGRAIALISPDSERTFATYLGAAVNLSAQDIYSSVFDGYKYFHIEGYLVQNHALLKKAVELAKKNNMIISLDLASYNVVEENLEFLKSIIKKYVDIVFANEEEAKAFTDKEPKHAVHIISENCEIAVVKIGKKGSLIKQRDNFYKIGIIPVNSVDTTGAGDLYASGFLYGLTKGFSLNQCGKIGSVLSGKVIEVIGSKMDTDKWIKINKIVKNL
jgi:sugar/nucleoside kinase (ribokinase family)